MTQTAQQSITHFDVIVVGGGMVGATLAALLGQAGVRVALVDAKPKLFDPERVGRGLPARRVSALTPVSQRLLEGLKVWPWMAARRITPYQGMQVWDSEGSGEVNFTAEQAGVAQLGHIVENEVVVTALEQRLSELPAVSVVLGARVTALQTPPKLGVAAQGETASSGVTLEDGRQLSAALVVAADGARSPLREMAGIEVRAQETGHMAVVTTVRTTEGHGGVARQLFRATGPLAFLPLTVEGDERHCSIVWSTSPEEAERLLALSTEELGRELTAAFEGRLGRVEVLDEALAVPLTQRHAKHYVQLGLALVGDAAHSIHPLAGQGVNLGLMDVAVLAEELLTARERGIALGEPRMLARYTRRRRGDNAAMLALMDGFRLLFGASDPVLTLSRNLGLTGVDRFTPLKRLLMRQAIGERGRLPRSCR